MRPAVDVLRRRAVTSAGGGVADGVDSSHFPLELSLTPQRPWRVADDPGAARRRRSRVTDAAQAVRPFQLDAREVVVLVLDARPVPDADRAAPCARLRVTGAERDLNCRGVVVK